MVSFSKLLDEALEQTNGVSMDEFVKFCTALITSTSVDKIPVAIERAMSLSSGELAGIVKQVQFTGDTKALENAIASKPEFATKFIELGRKVLPEEELEFVVEKIRGSNQNRVDPYNAEVDYYNKNEEELGGECDRCGSMRVYCELCEQEWCNCDADRPTLETDAMTPEEERDAGIKQCGSCGSWFCSDCAAMDGSGRCGGGH